MLLAAFLPNYCQGLIFGVWKEGKGHYHWKLLCGDCQAWTLEKPIRWAERIHRRSEISPEASMVDAEREVREGKARGAGDRRSYPRGEVEP